MGRIKKSKNKEIKANASKALPTLLDAIKSDDLILFSRLITEKKQLLHLCYGHFPILSACYLYQSKKIVKEYEEKLSSISNYDIVDEDFEVYKKFKRYAKRCLRLYYLNYNIITPLEMLAIINDSYYLKQVYNDFPKPVKVRNNIATIYKTLHNQDIDTQSDTINIKRKRLSKLQKVCAIVAIVFTSLILGVSISAWKGVHLVYGKGTIDAPYNIYNEKQLISAFKNDDTHYNLVKDITLTKKWNANDFKGHFDGDGNKIYVNNLVTKGFVNELSGDLKNVEFIFSPLSLDITEDFSLLVKTNNGLLQNISMDIKGDFHEKAEDDEVYFSLFVNENYGEINSCTINANVLINSDNEKNAFFSGFASFNYGNVLNCKTTLSSKFETDTVDLAGLVTVNENTGTVAHCINEAEIFQRSESELWNPNASGIALNNNGSITNCLNKGSIIAISKATDRNLSVYVGGIVCINNKTLFKCKNTGNIQGIAQAAQVSAGGIASLNNTEFSKIESCSAGGKINISLDVETDGFIFAGGVAGFNHGNIEKSFSLATFESTNGTPFMGGIVGVANYYTATYENNFYIAQPNITYGSATLLLNNTLYLGTDEGVIKVENEEELQEVEVYWE